MPHECKKDVDMEGLSEEDLTINKPETNVDESIMLALCDSLNELYDKLSILSNVMEKKISEHNLNQNDKGEVK